MKKLIILAAFYAVSSGMVFSQCPFTATISPSAPILCPNDTIMLSTQVYDSYQWYKDGVLIPGATSQSLQVTSNDAGSQFYVAATLSACTENSDTVLVDGWVFLLPYVIHNTPAVMTGGSGESYYCAGTVVELELGLPYDTNITWYESGNPIPGETSNIIQITQTGNYTVSGAPSLCPDFLQSLGVTIPIILLPPFEPNWPDWDGFSSYVFFNHDCTNCDQCIFYFVDTISNGSAPVDTGVTYSWGVPGSLDNLWPFIEYRAECYDSLGCLGIDTIEIYVGAIEEHPFLQLQLYPNPAQDMIQLFLQDDLENYQVRFMDIYGRIVKQQPLSSTIDISTMAAGIYTVEVFSKKYYLRKRLIKQ